MTFRSPAQPSGDFRGKAPSAYSELRFKLKLNVCKTIRRPGAAQANLQVRPIIADFLHYFPIPLDIAAFDEMGNSSQLRRFRRAQRDLFISDQVAELFSQQ